MAFVVLFSTMSFTISMHYCGDSLVDTAIFKTAKTCGMKMQNTSNKECAITKTSCCNDQQVKIEGQDDLNLSLNKLTLEQQYFLASFVYTYTTLFNNSNKKHSVFSEYPPPLLIKEIFKLDECYLI